MITSVKFTCPVCKNTDPQKVLFLGSEFSYQCLNCSAVHCFVENLYWDFTDNFKFHGGSDYKWKLSRYAGTRSVDGEWFFDPKDICSRTPFDVSNMQKWRVAFDKLIQAPSSGEVKVNVIKLSERSPKGLIFIANAVTNEHFQECFRAVVRMKEHLATEESKFSYNILLMDKKMDVCMQPMSKLKGVDEIWYVNWDKKQSLGYAAENPGAIQEAVALASTINRLLDSLEGEARIISKKASPCILGVQALKDLLSSEIVTLRTASGDLIEGKQIAVLVRSDKPERAGFSTEKQLKDVCNFVRKFGYKPLLIACSEIEEEICKSVSEPALFAKSLIEQVVFYENYCCGVIGTNGSGCNIPCLYEIPLLSFAKSRFFPDDFYCMGRLASSYDSSAAFYGKLSKPDSVIEIKVNQNSPTSILDHLEQAELWIKGLGGKQLSVAG